MLTAEIKVNGRLVSVVTIRNIAGVNGPNLVGRADYEVKAYKADEWAMERKRGNAGNTEREASVLDWDRSRPAHELVHAAIEAIMEASK